MQVFLKWTSIYNKSTFLSSFPSLIDHEAFILRTVLWVFKHSCALNVWKYKTCKNSVWQGTEEPCFVAPPKLKIHCTIPST